MERTLCIIKPDAVKKNVYGHIIQRILDEGFTIRGMKYMYITKQTAEKFYDIHKERPFYGELTDFMSSGHSVIIALEKENAVSEWRKLIGSTDPAEAEEGTIRKLYAGSKAENAAHGSDSVENGRNEVSFFFPEIDLL